MQPIDTLHKIREHLQRIGASDVSVELDEDFAPDVGTLVETRYEGAEWRLLPDDLLDLVSELPNQAGGEALKVAIEKETMRVWHGAEPPSRDTSP